MVEGERFNVITHLVGAVLALIGTIALVLVAVATGDAWKVLSAVIYGMTLVQLYTVSVLYHRSGGSARDWLREYDHVSIYFLIAGTYTPFCLVTLHGPWGWSVLGVEWGLGVIGAVVDVLWKREPRIAPVVVYVVMGWVAVVAVMPLLHALGTAGFFWLLAGGLFYTLGIIFYSLDARLRHAHGIWHLFVIAGSAAHYYAILRYVM
ncbi:MAG: hemolysin III family protein [Spongiibacteraceae bacterium]